MYAQHDIVVSFNYNNELIKHAISFATDRMPLFIGQRFTQCLFAGYN